MKVSQEAQSAPTDRFAKRGNPSCQAVTRVDKEGIPLCGMAPNGDFAYLRIDLDGHVILSDTDIQRIAAAVQENLRPKR